MATALQQYRFVGHAIISADSKIANSDGVMPSELAHPADREQFQAALDEATLIVLGRRSHESVPNRRGRKRLIMSRSVNSAEQRRDGWWWNPVGMPLQDALAAVAPGGGTIAIPGGRGVFDYFLTVGFDAFHLSRNALVTLPGGVAIFGESVSGTSAEQVLRGAGLHPGKTKILDSEEYVSMTVWRTPRR